MEEKCRQIFSIMLLKATSLKHLGTPPPHPVRPLLHFFFNFNTFLLPNCSHHCITLFTIAPPWQCNTLTLPHSPLAFQGPLPPYALLYELF
jgi:hypothetical protein